MLLKLGDVAGAFRHVSINAEVVHMFCFRNKDVLVIELACGFGCEGSPLQHEMTYDGFAPSFIFRSALTPYL
ncbi:hypothetical protein PPTG_24052 [Phytophthora nicotianae INRA-310]|uniref:Uncharacterized protein n=1 Tax=Phytophthora nicotianae (strain INRA-310) TaxID=761204 RepID=W2PMM1_PHYN3|nr:hypothetical protein PPTG_24052 [Phytophthora nicotianae INRA-310]ETN01499.1 hypothetical protein PPTG_24052 [Phytophthora nicotianae INRA-310]